MFVRTPAKLNLFLEILAKRPDGFHELDMLMVPIGIFDTLCFEEEESTESHLRLIDIGSQTGQTSTQHRDIPTGPDNLILKAVRAFQEYSGLNRQVRITVWKRIPAASGLAGGSSNAAATLAGLNRFWKAGLTDGELLELGATLGSDVNFFLAARSAAVCTGRGEIIQPIGLPANLSFVVVRPASGLSTAEVYRHCRPADDPRSMQPLVTALQAGRMSAAGNALHNALQPPAEQLNAEVSALRVRFEKLPVEGHQMTGSGTAYFGLCANRRIARRIGAQLRAERRGQVFVTHSVIS